MRETPDSRESDWREVTVERRDPGTITGLNPLNQNLDSRLETRTLPSALPASPTYLNTSTKVGLIPGGSHFWHSQWKYSIAEVTIINYTRQ